ncbi:MAG: hypothetical protein AB1757_31205 [Acidobacteriota bacterium]
MINYNSQDVTVLLKLCAWCAAELLESDRFCRRCGVNQQTGKRATTEIKNSFSLKNTDEPLNQKNTVARLTPDEAFEFYVTGDGLLLNNQPTDRYATTVLVNENPYRKFSGSLVKAIASGVTENTAPCFNKTFARRIIPAMILIPVWLVIILLSPLDAYATAKSLTKQLN